MDNLKFSDLLPELNAVQRKVLAQWLKTNIVEGDIGVPITSKDLAVNRYKKVLRRKIDKQIL